VALWIGNDEGLYHLAKECGSYARFVEEMRELGRVETPEFPQPPQLQPH
jgi:hypothetical protein